MPLGDADGASTPALSTSDRRPTALGFEAYRAASEQVFAILERHSPLVEPLSIDEAFVDVTGSERLFGDGRAVAERLRSAVREECRLTASVGVAPNKFLAKLASDLAKPDGLLVVDAEWVRGTLPTLAVARLWGVGPVLEAKLLRHGLRTFRDVANCPPSSLSRAGPGWRPHISRRSHAGKTIAPWCSTAPRSRSVRRGHSARTWPTRKRCGRCCCARWSRLPCGCVARGFAPRSISLKIRFGDFQTISRAATWEEPTDRTDLLWQRADALFAAWCRAGFVPIRLIGASLSLLTDAAAQPGLFTHGEDERRRRLDAVADRIAEKFGGAAVRRGGVRPDRR
jgi:DNA polymerase-4